MRKYLLFLLFPILLSFHLVEAATLHIIYLGDTNDQKIGTSVQLDIAHLQQEATRIASYTGLTKHEIVLTGKKDNSRDVIRSLNSLNVNSDDVIFFYYSGHGYRTPTKSNPWPNIVFTNEWTGIDLNAIIEHLKSKNPRLLIALSDSCNNPLPENTAPALVDDSLSRTTQKRAQNPVVRSNYRHLFMEARGVVVGVAAKQGGYSYGNPTYGGFYTYEFLTVMEHYTNNTAAASWQDILATTTQLLKDEQVGDYSVAIN